MALEKLLIGNRIRLIREEFFEESRKDFAERCDLNERYIGQLERGEFLLSMSCLDKISMATGVDTDFILYGKTGKDKFKIKDNLKRIIENADKEEKKMINKKILTVRNFVNKQNR